MVCSLAAGCGSGSDSGSGSSSSDSEGETAQQEEEKSESSDREGKVLTMMTYIDPESGDATQEAVYKVYEKFTEDTGIEIELNVVPWDQAESKVVITNQAGYPSDIALISSQKLASLVNSGALMALDEMIDADLNRDDFSDAV